MITNRSDHAYNPGELPRGGVPPEGAQEVIEVVLHATRSHEEPLEFREKMGWTKV